MSRIVVIGFDSEADARAALHTLRGVEKQGGIKFEDTALVSMDEQGKVHVKNESSAATEVGAVVGGIMGGMLLVVFPVAGIALGAAAGAGIGASLGQGIDEMRRIGKETLDERFSTALAGTSKEYEDSSSSLLRSSSAAAASTMPLTPTAAAREVTGRGGW